MIRTRNFLLYISALVFFVSSIGYMVSRDVADARYVASSHVAFNAAPVEPDVEAKDPADDREAYIARMREKLARGEGEIPGAPVTLTSVDSTPQNATASMPVTDRTIAWCGASGTSASVAASWDASEIDIRTAEGARIVTRGAFEAVASSSEMTIPDVVLQLPMRQVRASFDSCIPHDVIGITVDGDLIYNGDAVHYSSAGATSLIGYALDGFPIYGPVTDGTNMDSCGGTNAGAGYAYHVRADEDFMLSCFAAPPAQFLQ